VARLTEALGVAQSEKQLVELDLGRRIRSLEDQLARQRLEAATALADAKAAQASAETQVAALQQRLGAAKSQFDELVISGALYEELSHHERESLSLKQHVQLRLHEHVLGLHRKLEGAHRELEAAREALQVQERAGQVALREAQHARSLAEGREAGLREQVQLQTGTAQRLQARLTEALATTDSLQAKGAAFDAVQARVRELEGSLEAARRLTATQEASLSVIKADRDAASGSLRDLQLKVELLAADKAALSTALEEARAAQRRAQEALAHESDRLREAARQRDAFQEELVRCSGEARAAGEERLAVEVRRLREVSGRELEEIRAGLRAAAEAEARSLRDARDEAERRAARLQERVEALQAQVEAGARERRADGEHSAVAAAELRGLLSVKSLEAERLALASAEQADAIARLTGELDATRSRLSALTGEHARLEASADRDRAALQTALDAERAKAALYERLEAELDTAIVSAGHGEGAFAAGFSGLGGVAGAGGGGDAAAGGEEGASGCSAGSAAAGGGASASAASAAAQQQMYASSVGLSLATGVPTSSRRRLRQAVLLARELVQAQHDIGALKRQLAALQARHDEAAEEAARLRLTLEGVQGGPEYLVRQLRALEVELARSRAAADDARQQLAGARRMLQEVDAARQTAEADVRRLVASRQEVGDLAGMVQEALRSTPVAGLHHPLPPHLQPQQLQHQFPSRASGSGGVASGGAGGYSGPQVIVWHGYPPAAGPSGGLGALPPPKAPTGHVGSAPPHHVFSGGGPAEAGGAAGAPHPPRNGGGGSSASSVSMRSADLAVSAAGPGYNHQAGRGAAGVAGGGYGSGISTPLDSASTRTTPPKEQGNGGLRGAEWDLNAAPQAPAADARAHRAPLAPVAAAANVRHGGGAPAAYPSHTHAGGRAPASCEETDAMYTADVPLAGGIKYLAGVRPRAPQQQPQLPSLQPQHRAIGGHGGDAPAPGSPPQAPGGSGPEVPPVSAHRAVTFAGGVSAVEAPTATDHLVPHRGQTPPQPQARTVEVASFGAAAALAGPPARTMRFHGRRR
jgi:hypothetical protein